MAKLDNTQQMLRTIINGQSAFRQEMLRGLDQLGKRLEGRIDQVEKNLTERVDRIESRLDKIGKQLAYLEDDTPTREEFDNLEKRVGKMSEAPASQ